MASSPASNYIFWNGRCVDIIWKSSDSSNNWFITHSMLFPRQGEMPVWPDPSLNKDEARTRCVIIQYRDYWGHLPALENKGLCLFNHCANVRIYF